MSILIIALFISASDWSQNYKDLQAKEKWQIEDSFTLGWQYSEDACRIFPRYRVDAAIQVEVERLTPGCETSLEALRTRLKAGEQRWSRCVGRIGYSKKFVLITSRDSTSHIFIPILIFLSGFVADSISELRCEVRSYRPYARELQKGYRRTLQNAKKHESKCRCPA
jgi:hypothetical protein